MKKQRGSTGLPESGTKERRKRRHSIRRRVIRVALIPSIALVVLWLVVAGYLGFTGYYDQQVASGVRQVSIPAVAGLASIQKERQLSMAYLGHSSEGLQSLLAQQQQSDQQLAVMRNAAVPVLAHAPQSIVSRMTTLTNYLDQLPKIRGEIDAGVASTDDVSRFYDNLLDAATELFDTQASVVPDSSVIPGALAATDLFRASDLMSRASSIVTNAFASGYFSQQEFVQFTNLVGAYHAQLENVTPDLRPDVRATRDQLTSSAQWNSLVSAENAIIQRGPWSGGVPIGLPVNAASWLSLTDPVGNSLINLTVTQADEVSAQALADGNNQLFQLGIGLVIALLAMAGAIIWAIRESNALVDRALVTRLARLRDDALSLVRVRLPDIVRRLRDGKSVDVQSELPELHYGEDEIGQVAMAFNNAQEAVLDAVVRESDARHGAQAVFLGIARRNQAPLHRMLNQLDMLEQREQENPSRLKELFKLDHQATQVRRNSENLIILGGGQLGRRWHEPIAVLEVLRSAIAETKQYDRIKLQSAPEETIIGDAVAGIGHLVSELLDNAISFSSPDTRVQVSSKRAKLGVVVEVEDQGVGMSDDAMEHANALLADPPEFDVRNLKDGSQLGFWVIAHLAVRLGVTVQLRQSPYGGVHAILMIPNKLLASSNEGKEATQPTDVETTMEIPIIDSNVESNVAPADTSEMDELVAAAVSAPETYSRRGRHADKGVSESKPLSVNGTHTKTENDHVEDVVEHSVLAWTGPRDDLSDDSSSTADISSERPVLPQRKPQQHIVWQLRDEDIHIGQMLNEDADEGPSSDDIRRRLSAFQKGSSDGRNVGDSRTP